MHHHWAFHSIVSYAPARVSLWRTRGMDYLHQNNIIHRDLKSANLLLNTQGTVKVADFGLARVEAQEPGNMTAETGTIRWMAPEVRGGGGGIPMGLRHWWCTPGVVPLVVCPRWCTHVFCPLVVYLWR